MTIKINKPGEGSPQLTRILFIAFCLAAVPASSDEPDPPGQFAMQWLGKLSLTSVKPSPDRALVESQIIDRRYLKPGDALPEDLLRVICRDRRWRDYAASLGGEWHYKNLCLQRLKKQKK